MKDSVTEQIPGKNAVEWIPLRGSRQKPFDWENKRIKEGGANDLWLITLSDLLLLLVIFFVLLFGMTFQGREKQSLASPQTTSVTSVQTEPEETRIEQQPVSPPDSPAKGILDSFEKDLRTVVGGQEEKEMLTVARQADNVILTFPERIIFDSGKAELKPSVRPILQEVGALALAHPHLLVEVQGHTDDRPINTNRYASNWELSVGRATQVVKALIALGLDPARISVRGFGEYQTRYPNDCDSNRSKNRRVEIQFSSPPQP